MSDTWFDSTSIKNYNRDILPHINNLEEGYFLQKEKREQDIERFMARKRRDRDIAMARNKVRQQRAVHAQERGNARRMDIETGQPVSGKNSGVYYESVKEIVENKESGKTKKHNEKFRGFDDFRKDFRLSTRTALIGDDKEKDKLRKREERRLQELFSLNSIKVINEEETEDETENGSDDADQKEETAETKGSDAEENVSFPPIESMFEQLKGLRYRVKNVFENLSNISYKTLNENYNVSSINKDDREYQIENAIILVSRICSGASMQEMQYMQQFENSRFFDFDEEAFDSARKLLSELGEMCFQNLIHINEIQTQSDFSGSGRTQILCGQNTFKIITGKVYIKESTSSPNYGMKLSNVIQTILPNIIPQTEPNQENPENPDNIDALINFIMQALTQFSSVLINDENPDINTEEAMRIVSSSGVIQNNTIPDNAKLSKAMSSFSIAIEPLKKNKKILKNSKFAQNLKNALTRYYISGINQLDPRNNASHILTDNGLFIIDDSLIFEYSKKAELNFIIKNSEKSSNGRRANGSTIPKSIEKNRTIVEKVIEEMKPKIKKEDIIVNGIDLVNNVDTIFYQELLKVFDIEFSISLNPGNFATTKEKQKNEYNVININDKEYKIPVKMDRGDMSTKTIKEHFETIFTLRRNQKLLAEKLTGHEKHYSKKTSHHRSNRNKARRAAEEKWGKAAIKGKDVDHKDGNPMNNSPSNLRLRNPSDNRADNGHHKGEPYKKAKRGITNTYKGKDK